MKNHHSLLACAMLLPTVASAALINLTTDLSFPGVTNPGGAPTSFVVPTSTFLGTDGQFHAGARVNGAVIIPTDNNSGSGVYRRLYELDQSGGGIADGYNRELPKDASPNDFESKIPGGFNPYIRISDLVEFGGYYGFSLDINDPSNYPEGYESVDEIKLFVGGSSDPAFLPGTSAGLSGIGALVYDLQAGLSGSQRNSIMLDTHNGSGRDEMTIFFPKSVFEGYSPDSFVYLYSKLGELGTPQTAMDKILTGFNLKNGGFDEWATVNVALPQLVQITELSTVPEPSSALTMAILMTAGVSFRSRRTLE